MNEPQLTIISSVPVATDSDFLAFDRKFFDGMLRYREYWPGPLKCVARAVGGVGAESAADFDHRRVAARDLPFEMVILSPGELAGAAHLRGSSFVLAAGDDFDQLHVSEICRRENIPCVYMIENIPETRHQIVDIDTPNPLRRLRRHWFVMNGERRRVAAFRRARGLQANGTAAFEHYRWHPDRHLYFDTRVEAAAMISDAELQQRLATLASRRPLRLAFSGRLTGIKGADQLVDLAGMLAGRGLAFEMTIYGSGDLEHAMAEGIREKRLGDRVQLAGAVDFRRQLLPAIKSDVDLYVMLHRQSDPSCTYLETLACGIPIVGYANKAFSGLLARKDMGWEKPPDDLSGVADVIMALDANRAAIPEKSKNALAFSRAHDFESTFSGRVEHLRRVSEIPSPME